jgi:hypothetical protein
MASQQAIGHDVPVRRPPFSPGGNRVAAEG